MEPGKGDVSLYIYVVQPGDTLWQISQRTGVSISELVTANGIVNPNLLAAGQALVIPVPDVIHAVQPGDTLWRIAQRYDVTINEIINANNIQNANVLFVGQRLIIPAPYTTHTIRPGETLWQIARLYKTTIQDIIRVNNIQNPSLIYAGQQILVRKPVIETNGYLTSFGTAGQNVARNTSPYLTYFSIFSYGIAKGGGLSNPDDTAVRQIARSNGAAPLMVITNFEGRTFSPELARDVLSSREAQETLVSNILQRLESKNFAGLNIDFEYVPPDQRENYNAFLQRVADAIRPRGFLLSSALAPKETAGQIGLLYEAHDYPAHGRINDFVVLMTYEWGYAAGPPWAIAPENKVRDILDYAITAIPREKILMGVPTYGRDWRLPYQPGTVARTISPVEAVSIAAQRGSVIQFHPVYLSPYFYYTDDTGVNHEVWFEDARSLQYKFNLVNEYGLKGISYWELSSPFPQNWLVLQHNFQIRKII